MDEERDEPPPRCFSGNAAASETAWGGAPEATVENQLEPGSSRPPELVVTLLGPTAVQRQGLVVQLPRSRKVRALLAFLVLEGRPVARARLCDLLWDVPNDPCGELRWCLSKLRAAEQRLRSAAWQIGF